MAELAWENGRLVLHGLGHDRIEKPIPKEPSSSAAAAAAWEKPRPSGTLEALVDQATRAQLLPPVPSPGLASCLAGPQAHHSTQTVMDALVPCTAAPGDDVADPGVGRKRARVGEGGWVCASQGSAAVPGAGKREESTRVTLDTCGVDDVGFTTTANSASPSRVEGDDGESPETENTSFGGGVGSRGGGGRRVLAFDDGDSVCLSRRSQADGGGACADEEKATKGRLSASTRRRRAAAVHNQSERKRRDRINQKMKALQKLVPNSNKTDKASMLDEVIVYLKQLQAQIQMMSRMSTMMMPMAMPQLQMSMMSHMAHMAQTAHMGMGMGMGMMEFNPLGQLSHASLPPLVPPSAFLPLPTNYWDGFGDKMQQSAGGTVRSDPFSAFLAYQTAQPPLPVPQPPLPPAVGMDAYSWMAALHQQLRQQPPPDNRKH